MAGAATIQYLQNHKIDRARWDACVDRSTNALIYAYSFYLDKVCDNWDAIIIDNYKAVMPIAWRRKFGFTYVYPPPFIQQMGIYSCHDYNNLIPEVLKIIKSKFSFGEYYFNYATPLPFIDRCNFTLDLNREYSIIRQAYNNDLKRELKKAQHYKLHYIASNDYKKSITIHQEMYGSRMPHINAMDLDGFTAICKHLQQNDSLLIREVINADNELLTTTLCLKYKNRVYLWLSSTTLLGRELKASHFLHDQLIQEFSGKDLILDFVGSDIPGVNRFYAKFGAINHPYFFYRWNYLPWPFKLLKKPTTSWNK